MPDAHEPRSVAYLIFILGVSLLAILLLAFGTLGHLNPQSRAILDYADTALCVLFLLDFLQFLVEDRFAFFQTLLEVG